MFKKILLLTILLISIGYTKDNIVVYNAYGNNHQVIVQGRMERKRDFKIVRKDDGLLRNLWRRVKQVKADDIKSKNIIIHLNKETFKTKGNDDTIIVSDVTNKISFGINTMFKNYKQRTLVPTMLKQFKKILSQNPKGTPSTLFILSGSPQQLFTPIEQFLEYYHFPKHTLILKKAHGKNLDPLTDQFAYKTQKIELLIKLYPHMKWIIFGDSGEKDYQVYKAIKEKYPKKVLQYYIRNIKNGKIQTL